MSFDRNLFLAPLAGYTDPAFRVICRRFGATRVFTGMVNAEGLSRRNAVSLGLLGLVNEERPVGVQLFGSNPRSFAEAARILNDMRPDFIDLNFGCSVKKILSQGSGAALLKSPARIAEIVQAVASTAEIPVTAKIRLGYGPGRINCVQVAKILEDGGASLVTVHARLSTDTLSARPNWDPVAEVKSSVRIPVVANGGIFEPDTAKAVLERTGCDGVMIGRGAVGKPWVFGQIRDFLADGIQPGAPGAAERLRTVREHLELTAKISPDRNGFVCFKKHLLSYLKGLHGARDWRATASRLESLKDTEDFLTRIEEEISGRNSAWTKKN